jgi:hypothetical protein
LSLALWLIVFTIEDESVVVVGRSTILVPYWSHGLDDRQDVDCGQWEEEEDTKEKRWIMEGGRDLVCGSYIRSTNK